MSNYAINIMTYILFIREAFNDMILDFGHDPRLARDEWDALEAEHTCACELLTPAELGALALLDV